MIRFIVHWLVVSAALAAAAWLLPGVHVSSIGSLLCGGLAIGLVNAVVRPVLTLLSLPITILTLGLFLLVVNGAAFALAAWLTPGFAVANLWWAILGSLVVSVVSWFASTIGEERA